MTGEELRAYREQQGLTQRQLAHEIGVKWQPYISNWELGRKPIPQPIQELLRLKQKIIPSK